MCLLYYPFTPREHDAELWKWWRYPTPGAKQWSLGEVVYQILEEDFFAFTWADPDTHQSSQLTLTVLPQGFWDSLHFFFFGRALASDLTSLDLTPGTVLQCVDDLTL